MTSFFWEKTFAGMMLTVNLLADGDSVLQSRLRVKIREKLPKVKMIFFIRILK
jgi:hypothetical protein